MDAREQDVAYRLAALKEELLAPIRGVRRISDRVQPLVSKVTDEPGRLLAVAGVTGAALGVVLGLRSRREARRSHKVSSEFMQARLSTFIDDAASRVAKGKRPEAALDDLFRRVPVVYADRQLVEDTTNQTSLGKTLVKSALGFGLKMAMDALTQRFTGHEETFSALADEQA